MRLTICLLTYDRLDYASRTLRSTLDNIRFSGELAVHIADDGSGDEYIKVLHEIAGGYPNIVSISVSNSGHKGYGANYNLAMQQVHPFSECILPLEDDWELTKILQADNIVNVLENKQNNIGCIRLGYLGYTQELRGAFKYINGEHYILLDSNSPEPHIFAGHPRIETREWARTVGPWPEGLDPNLTEFKVTHMPNARKGVAWPASLIQPDGGLFVHIGAVRAR